ncbi:MAG: PIN domain-containing protein [Planctomycetia bacterium]|nr:PIN domain-containing protein [Planctomycetia bacterium]
MHLGVIFQQAQFARKSCVDGLLDSDRVATTGAVVSEVLIGFRRKDQADWVASRLRMTHYVEANWDDWQAAANLGRELAANGVKLPLTDLLVATLALRCQAWVYTTDPHFDVITELKRFHPDQPGG